MGKGEIARYEQFLFFPQCFQKTDFPGASKGVIVWEWVKQTISPFLSMIFYRIDKLSYRFTTSEMVTYELFQF